jgi:hypothetical protein
MRRSIAAICLALAMGAAQAAEPVDLLFNTPHLKGVQPGSVLRYDHVRRSDPTLDLGPDIDEAIAVEMGQGAAKRFMLDADGQPRVFEVNDGVPGNPLLMVFLESTLRSVAKATGGSPFYLRNRMREALRDGLTQDGDALTMRPFAQDANRVRLGAFADMSVRFELSDKTPGMVVSMAAEAGPEAEPVYSEEIRYETLR